MKPPFMSTFIIVLGLRLRHRRYPWLTCQVAEQRPDGTWRVRWADKDHLCNMGEDEMRRFYEEVSE